MIQVIFFFLAFVVSFLDLPADVHASILSYLSIPTLLRSSTLLFCLLLLKKSELGYVQFFSIMKKRFLCKTASFLIHRLTLLGTVSKQWKAVTCSQALWSLIARRNFGDRSLFHGRKLRKFP